MKQFPEVVVAWAAKTVEVQSGGTVKKTGAVIADWINHRNAETHLSEYFVVTFCNKGKRVENILAEQAFGVMTSWFTGPGMGNVPLPAEVAALYSTAMDAMSVPRTSTRTAAGQVYSQLNEAWRAGTASGVEKQEAQLQGMRDQQRKFGGVVDDAGLANKYLDGAYGCGLARVEYKSNTPGALITWTRSVHPDAAWYRDNCRTVKLEELDRRLADGGSGWYLDIVNRKLVSA